MFAISDSTITNWTRSGLKPVDGQRPQLFAGYELRQFLTNLRWPHGRPPENGRLFCSSCLGFKALFRASIRVVQRDIRCPLVTGQCIDCHTMLQSGADTHDLASFLDASANTAGGSSDVYDGLVPCSTGGNRASIPPETNSTNLRWLYGYRVYLEHHQNLDAGTVDEHLRAINRMSAFLGQKCYERVTIADARRFKDELRGRRNLDEGKGLSRSTVLHTIDRCRVFFRWLQRQPGVTLETDLPGYFNLSRNERSAEASMSKGTSINFNQALLMFASVTGSDPVAVRNRAIIALFIVTGMRISALISLRGKHVNMTTRWINQDPREVNTKLGKHIRTYCLDLGSGLLAAIEEWVLWRGLSGFGDDAPFFLPDRYLQANALGFGYRAAGSEPAQCWQSEEPVQRMIKAAATAAGIPTDSVSSHDFRKVLHPFLSRRGAMMIAEEVALQLNLGHTPQEIIRKHYANMQDSEREEILDDLTRRALSNRSELDRYLGYERGEITESDPDYMLAKQIYERQNLDKVKIISGT